MGKMEMILSYAAGLVYAVGLWLWIDGTVISVREYNAAMEIASSASAEAVLDPKVKFVHWLPFIFSTVALVMVNLPSHEQVFGDGSGLALGTDTNVGCVRAWLLGSFVVLFGSLVAAIWVACDKLMDDNVVNTWPGATMIIASVCATVAAFIYRFQRSFEEEDDFHI